MFEFLSTKTADLGCEMPVSLDPEDGAVQELHAPVHLDKSKKLILCGNIQHRTKITKQFLKKQCLITMSKNNV
jgi:hypothetical protein